MWTRLSQVQLVLAAAGEEQPEAHGSWLHFLVRYLPARMRDDRLLISWLIVVGLVLLCYLGTRRATMRPRGLQNFLEIVVEGLERFCVTLMGPEGKGFAPFVGSLFIYILVMNLFGLVPGMQSPTNTLSMTLSLALVVFLATQYQGLRAHRFGYLKHFLGEPLWLAPLMLPVHLIGELARPISLSVRLYGNIFGEDQVIVQLAWLAPLILGFIPIPVQFPMMAFAIFTSLVQALVFSLLAGVYIAGAIGVHGGEEAH